MPGKQPKFQYVILEDANAERRSAGPRMRRAGPSVFGTSNELRDSPPELSVSSAQLSNEEAADVRRAPNTLGVARRLPLRLIEPFSIAAPADLSSEVTWGIEAVGAAGSAFDGEPVTVAVLDTGIDPSHPAFSGVALERRNFTSETDDDTNGHGTHCAGTIFGRDVDHDGISTRIGVARGVRRALIGKVLGAGAGTDALISAITWARDQGAHVISMSLGYDHAGLQEELEQFYPTAKAASELLSIFVENIRQFDTLVQHLDVRVDGRTSPVIVAASGNESENDDPNNPYRISAASPSSADGIMSVGALQQAANGEFTVAPFSNTNVDVAAPGVDILSAATGGGLVSFSGTSMACPHVAGLAALGWHQVLSEGLPRTPDTVTGRMIATATRDRIASGESRDDFGNGLVQAP